MPRRAWPVSLFGLLFVMLALAAGGAFASENADGPRYLFTWAGDADRSDNDFLAVIDLAAEAEDGSYGRVAATLPVGERGLWPHHTEHELGPSRTLFANGFASGRTLVFDLENPLEPSVSARFEGAGDLSFPHSFVRTPGGNVLAAFQGLGPRNQLPGGIAEITPEGQVVRVASAADPAADFSTLRPYSLAVAPKLDRIVIGMNAMPMPDWHPNSRYLRDEGFGNQVQIRRLSDLSLVKTIRLPEAHGPNEPRLLADESTVLVSSAYCFLYRVIDLGGDSPSLELVRPGGQGRCAGPVVIGDYWIQSNAGLRQVVALDVRDLEEVRQVSSVNFDERQTPHWLSTDGRRIVVVNEPFSEPRMWMLRFDPESGRLELDVNFRDAGSERVGVSFDRESWPHGASGPAVPHGTVFSW